MTSHESPESPREPIIEMALKPKSGKGVGKPNAPETPSKGKNVNQAERIKEKTQAELREALKKRFGVLTSDLKNLLDEYDQMLAEGVFEDKDGEQTGSGEKRKESAQAEIESSMSRAEKMKKTLDSKEPLPQSQSQIEAEYTHTNPATHAIEHQETITLDIEKKTLEFLDFYKKTGIDLPPDFEETIKEIWERNYDEIQQAVEQQGFDEILILPANLPLPDLSEKMKMQNGYFTGSNFDAGGGFAGAVSPNVDKPRLILVHKTQNLKDRPELKATLNIKGQDVDLTKTLTLEDYLVFQRKYFEETNKHLDEDGWTWLSTKSGARLVHSCWDPDSGRLCVHANDLGYQSDNLGTRPSRSFF